MKRLKKRSLSRLSDSLFYFVNTTFLIVLFFLIAIPLLYVVSASFSNPIYIAQGKLLFIPRGFNLEGYRRVFSNKDIWIGLRNSILYTGVGTFFNLFMTAAGAYPLSRKDLKHRNIFTFIFVFTMLFNAGLIPQYLLMKRLHLIDNPLVMILPCAINVTNLMIMRTFFTTNIPMEIQEAATIDGCGNLKLFFQIVLPLSKSVMAVLALYYGIAHWNQYFNALIYLTNRNYLPLQVFLREILMMNDISTMTTDVGTTIEQLLVGETLKYSLIIVASLPVVVIYPFMSKYFVKGVMIGAVKG